VLKVSSLGRWLIAIFFVVVSLFPFFWFFLSSLKTHVEIFEDPFSFPEKPIWSNYIRAWHEGKIGLYWWNTVIMTLPSLALIVVVALMAGYAFARFRLLYWCNLSFSIILIGLIIPIQSLMIPLYHTFVNLGLIDTMGSLIIALVAIQLPFSIFLMRSFFLTQPTEVIEAAKIDGCSEFGVFRHIVLPLAKPGILTLVVIQFMNIWRAFLLPLLLIHDDAKRPLTLGLMFLQSAQTRHYEILAAGVIISSVPIIILFILAGRYFEEGLVAGSYR